MQHEIIKEYLVSIGFDVDKPSISDTERSIKRIESTLDKFVKRLGALWQNVVDGVFESKPVRTFLNNATKFFDKIGPKIQTFLMTTRGFIITGIAAVGTALAAFVAVGTALLHRFMSTVSQADMEVQKFARRMLMSVENARSLRAVMNQMGLKSLDDLQDVAVNPELRSQFFALRQLSANLSLGRDEKEGLRNIRAFNFEFQKLGLTMDYFFQKLAGYLGKFLGGPLKNIQEFMSSFNEGFVNNADRIAQDIGEIVGIFYKLIQVASKGYQLIFGVKVKGTGLDNLVKLFEFFLDIVSVTLDKSNEFMDLLSSFKPTVGFEAPGAGNTVKTLNYYVQRIYELLSQLWNWISRLHRMPGEWLTGVQSAIGGFVGGAAENIRKAFSSGEKSDSPLHFLLQAAKNLNLPVTSTTGGRHNPGSLHTRGQAIDVSSIGMTIEKIRALQGLGIKVLDERVRPRGQKEWSGPHYHLEFTAAQYRERMQRTQLGADSKSHTASATQPVSIIINGAQDPMAVAMAVESVLSKQARIMIRNTQGAYA